MIDPVDNVIEEGMEAAVDFMIEKVLKSGGTVDEVLLAYALLYTKYQEAYYQKFSDALDGIRTGKFESFEKKFSFLEDMMIAQLETLGHPVFRTTFYIEDMDSGNTLCGVRKLIENRFKDVPGVYIFPLEYSLLTIDVSTATRQVVKDFLEEMNEMVTVTERPLLKAFINEFNNWETAADYIRGVVFAE